MKKIEDDNTLVFIVNLKANKIQIKNAVKKLYDIQADKVNTLIRYVTSCLLVNVLQTNSLSLIDLMA